MFALTYLDPETNEKRTCRDAEKVFVTKYGAAIETSKDRSVYIPWHRVNGLVCDKKDARRYAEAISSMRA